MLIDEWLPVYDVVERHSVAVEADPAVVYRALREVDLGAHPAVRAALALRSLPTLLASRKTIPRSAPRMDMAAILAAGFRILGEDDGRELVIGVVGRFWRPTGNIEPFEAARFAANDYPGCAKAAWNFAVCAHEGGTRLTTETRVRCSDASSRRKFRLYWLFVRPGSGMIRVFMLRAVKRYCESASG